MFPGIYTQPTAPPMVAVPVKSEWSSGLCSCMEDFNLCCYGMWCPGCTTVNSMKIINHQYPSFCDNFCGVCLSVITLYWVGCLCHGIAHKNTRELVARQYNIEDESTCLRSFFCIWCSACQIEREIEFRRKQAQSPIQTIKQMF